MAQRKKLVDVVVDDLLTRIFSEELGHGAPLPSEDVLASQYDVSRVTVRQAVQTLAASNVITVRRGVGTFVNPASQWTSLNTVLQFSSHREGDTVAAVHLIGIRRMVEAGAAALAARRRTEENLEALRRHLDGMRESAVRSDVDGFVREDMAFHDVILRASDNIFVPVILEPLSRILYEGRRQTSAVPQIQQNAIRKHTAILAALETSDSERARLAMEDHMDQTVEDLRNLVLNHDKPADRR